MIYGGLLPWIFRVYAAAAYCSHSVHRGRVPKSLSFPKSAEFADGNKRGSLDRLILRHGALATQRILEKPPDFDGTFDGDLTVNKGKTHIPGTTYIPYTRYWYLTGWPPESVTCTSTTLPPPPLKELHNRADRAAGEGDLGAGDASFASLSSSSRSWRKSTATRGAVELDPLVDADRLLCVAHLDTQEEQLVGVAIVDSRR